MWIYKLSLEITTCSSLILGFFVLSQNRGAKINQVFFSFSMVVAIYTFFLARGGFAADPGQALLFSKLLYIGVILIPPIFYHLTLRLLGQQTKLIYIFYFIAAIFLVSLPTSYFISGTRYFEEFGIYSQKPGGLYFPFLGYFFAVVIYSLYITYQKYRIIRGLQKTQLGYFFYGSSIGFLGGAMDYLPKFGFFIHPLNTYCNFLIAIYIGSFAYAIIKYRLMDIRVIIRKGLIYSALIAISTGLYLFAVLAIGQFTQLTIGSNPLLIGGLIIFVFVFASQPLKNRVQETIDRIFFKSRYEYQNTLRHLSQVAVSVMSLEDLSALISNKVTEVMKLERASVMVLNKDGNGFRIKCVSEKRGNK